MKIKFKNAEHGLEFLLAPETPEEGELLQLIAEQKFAWKGIIIKNDKLESVSFAKPVE